MLKHLTVIVTGAASGIGREVVKSCLQEGASVTLMEKGPKR